MMHQYHLGDLEQEKERELVLYKIFYQTNTRARTKKIKVSLVLVLVLPCRPQVGIVVNTTKKRHIHDILGRTNFFLSYL